MAEQSEDSFNVKFAKELSQKYRHIEWNIENSDRCSDTRESYDSKSSGNGLASSENYAESAKRMIDYYIKDGNYSKKE